MRRAIPGDEAILREVRLQALSDAPDAFGSTYERELERTTSDRQRWLSPGATFILDGPEGARGIVGGVPDSADPAIVAESVGAASVRLNVMQPNHRARHFYERCGFRPTGRGSIRERDGSIEVQMERLI